MKGTHKAARSVASHPDHRNRSWRQSTQNRRNDTLTDPAASSYVCPVDDAAESFVVGVVVAPDDVPADHAGLLVVAGVIGAIERKVAQGPYTVLPANGSWGSRLVTSLTRRWSGSATALVRRSWQILSCMARRRRCFGC